MASISANGAKGHHKFTLYVTEASTNTANNTSSINWSFDISAIQNGWDFYTIGSTITIKINGETVYNEYAQRSFGGSGSTTWASGTTTVAHNADGTKSISFSFEYSQSSTSSYTPGNASNSGSMTLTTIPRYFSSTPTLTLSSKTETTATFNWSTPENASRIQYKINSGGWVEVETGVNKKSGSFTISGLSANTSYTIYGDFMRYDSGLWAQTKPSVNITTYNYPYIQSISNSNFTVGDEVNISVYNPLKRACTAYIKQNSTSGKLLGSVSGFTYGSATYNVPLDKDALYSSLPNSTTGNCVYYIVSSSPSHTSGTVSGKYTIKETANNGEAKPTFTNFTIEDTDSTVLALTGNSSKIVLGYSDVKATISTTDKAIANKSSTMKTYKMLVGGETVTANYSSSSNVVLSLNNIKFNSIQVSAQDSRGFATAVTKTFTNLGYTEPVIKAVDAKLTRSNNGIGEQVTLTFSGKYWNKSFGAKTNSIVGLKYYYRKSNSTTDWIGPFDIYEDISYNNDVFSYNHIIAGDLENKGFDITESYSVRLYYRDELYSSYIDLTLGSGTPNIAIAEKGTAFGSQYDNNVGGTLQVDGHRVSLESYPVGSIYISTNSTSPASLFGGTWEQLKDRFLLACGDTYSNGATGGEATHKLTVNEIPAHNHSGIVYIGNSQHISLSESGNTGYNLSWSKTGNSSRGDISTTNAGGSQAHNNMPPYLTVYMWKRTA